MLTEKVKRDRAQLWLVAHTPPAATGPVPVGTDVGVGALGLLPQPKIVLDTITAKDNPFAVTGAPASSSTSGITNSADAASVAFLDVTLSKSVVCKPTVGANVGSDKVPGSEIGLIYKFHTSDGNTAIFTATIAELTANSTSLLFTGGNGDDDWVDSNPQPTYNYDLVSSGCAHVGAPPYPTSAGDPTLMSAVASASTDTSLLPAAGVPYHLISADPIRDSDHRYGHRHYLRPGLHQCQNILYGDGAVGWAMSNPVVVVHGENCWVGGGKWSSCMPKADHTVAITAAARVTLALRRKRFPCQMSTLSAQGPTYSASRKFPPNEDTPGQASSLFQQANP